VSFIVRIHLLTGRYSATCHHKRDEGEWPPHPDRFFQALTSAHYNPAGEEPDPDERALLEHLEALAPPNVICSFASQRSVLQHFVPVNDVKPPTLKESDKLKKKIERVKEGLGLLPDTRPKQPRFFPTVVPDHPDIYLRWNSPLKEEQSQTLSGLLSRVVRVGHSSSFVSCSLVESIEWPETLPCFEFAPTEGQADVTLRAPHQGRLAALDRAFDRKLRPSFVSETPYRRVQEETEVEVARGPYESTMVVFRAAKGQRPFPLTQTLRWTAALRGYILKNGGGDLPPAVTGHDQSGAKMEAEHIAIVPLANVGHSYADGSILGFGVVFPREVQLGSLLDDMGREPFTLNRRWEIERIQDFREAPPASLRPWTYVGRRSGRCEWATVTPMVLDYHLKTKIPRRASREEKNQAVEKRFEEIRGSIGKSLAALGLPEALIEVSQAPFVSGSAHVRQFPFDRRGRLCRYHTHVRLIFSEPVRGPILLGSARFRGYGLFRPINSVLSSDQQKSSEEVSHAAQH